ncbi:MAG TPA: hypothetical protein PLJ35_01750 [Anaerolineae bacterium]|nr:hypothetical protein [Anaerolineae bacterium]HPL27513.1 hypothetical protein [Anaerolineae bacterium]
MSAISQELLAQVTAILPFSREDPLYKGVASALTERLLELKRADGQFAGKYGSIARLEERIKAEGVPPDDHALYDDLLQWRAIGHETSELMRLLRAL